MEKLRAVESLRKEINCKRRQKYEDRELESNGSAQKTDPEE